MAWSAEECRSVVVLVQVVGASVRKGARIGLWLVGRIWLVVVDLVVILKTP